MLFDGWEFVNDFFSNHNYIICYISTVVFVILKMMGFAVKSENIGTSETEVLYVMRHCGYSNCAEVLLEYDGVIIL